MRGGSGISSKFVIQNGESRENLYIKFEPALSHSLQSTDRSLIISFSYFQKIEKLQSSLHLLGEKDDSQPTNQHIVFVDTKKEGKHQSCSLKFKLKDSFWGVQLKCNTVSSV